MKNVETPRERERERESSNLKKEKIKLFVGTRRALSFWCNKTKQKHTNKIMSNVVGGSISMRPAGITLIALVITIIVLLILAGVALNMIMGDSGIFGKANTAKDKTKENEAIETVQLALISARAEYTISPEGMNLETYVENENKKIEVEVENTNSDRKVLGDWKFTYNGYVFGINDLKIQSSGPENKKVDVTASAKNEYVFESDANAKVEIGFTVDIKDNSLNGKPVTIESLTTDKGTVTVDSTNKKAYIEKNGTNPLNGDYNFKVKIELEEAQVKVTVDKFLKDPKIVVPEDDLKWNGFKIQIKQDNEDEDNYPTGVTYKYTVTGTGVNINNQESTSSELQVTGTEAEKEYSVSILAIIGETSRPATTKVPTPEKFEEIYTINDLEAIGTDSTTLAGKYKLKRSLDFRNPDSYENGASDARYIYYNTDNDGDGKPDNSWTPIGSADWDGRFCGVLDGDYHIIKNLYINDPDLDYASLMGNVGYSYNDPSTVRRLFLCDVDITGGNRTAGICGMQSYPMEELKVTGIIRGTNTVAGISSDTVQNAAHYCCFSGTLVSTGQAFRHYCKRYVRLLHKWFYSRDANVGCGGKPVKDAPIATH